MRNLQGRGARMEYWSGMPNLSYFLGITYLFLLSHLMGTLFASSMYFSTQSTDFLLFYMNNFRMKLRAAIQTYLVKLLGRGTLSVLSRNLP